MIRSFLTTFFGRVPTNCRKPTNCNLTVNGGVASLNAWLDHSCQKTEVGCKQGHAPCRRILLQQIPMTRMWRVSAKFIPKLLMEQQKELHVEIAQDMLYCANNDLEFMKTIITGDEAWVYGYNPETKFQSSQRKHPESPRSKKARQVCSNVKVMLTCFFDSHSIVHHEYAPEGQTINKE